MSLTPDERQELEHLRQSARLFITNPLDKVCFELESMLERAESTRQDAVISTAGFRLLARAVLLLKQELTS